MYTCKTSNVGLKLFYKNNNSIPNVYRNSHQDYVQLIRPTETTIRNIVHQRGLLSAENFTAMKDTVISIVAVLRL